MANIIKISQENIGNLSSFYHVFIYANKETNKYIIPFLTAIKKDKHGLGMFGKDNYDLPISEEDVEIIKHIPTAVVFIDKNIYEEKGEFLVSVLPALKNANVRIIPIIVDEETVSQYQSVFGDIEYLKLDDQSFAARINEIFDYLENNSKSNKLNKIFDKKIFVSYRKKDIKEVLRFLKVIRKADELKFVTFWFDYFLTPGEEFNDEISSEIDESDLVIVMVTRNVFENDNYIITNEYPYALKSKKPIIAIKLEDLSSFKIKHKFKHLMGLFDLNDPKLTNDICKILKIDTNSQADSSKLYQAGLCYLEGFGVEKDSSLGERCLIEAAEKENKKAIRELATRYKCGNGLPKNVEKSVYWYEKMKDELGYNPKEAFLAASVYASDGKFDEAIKMYEKILENVKTRNERSPFLRMTNIRNVYLMMGLVYSSSGDFFKARKNMGLALREALSFNYAHKEELKSLFYSTYMVYIEFAVFYNSKIKNKELATFFVRKTLEGIELDGDTIEKPVLMRLYSKCLTVLGRDAYVLEKMLQIAESDYFNHIDAHTKACSFVGHANYLADLGDYKSAIDSLNKYFKIILPLTNDTTYFKALAALYECKHRIYTDLRKYNEASVAIEEAYNCSANKSPNPDDLVSYALALKAAISFSQTNQLSAFKMYLDKSETICNRIVESKKEPRALTLMRFAKVYYFKSLYSFTVNGNQICDDVIIQLKKAVKCVEEALVNATLLDIDNLILASDVYYQMAASGIEGGIVMINKSIAILDRLLEVTPSQYVKSKKERSLKLKDHLIAH